MKLLKNKIAKAGLFYTIGNILIKGIVFFSTPLFTRFMTPEDFGIVSNYLAMETIATIFIGLLTYSSIKNAKYEFKGDLEQYISNLLLVNISVALIDLILLNLVYQKIGELFSLSLGLLNLMVLNCLGSSIIFIFNNYLSLKYYYKEYIIAAFFNVFSNVLLSTVLMISWLKNDLSSARILGYCIPVMILSIYIVYRFFSMRLPNLDKRYYKFAFCFCLPLIPNGLADVILGQFDRIMIKSMVGSSALGIYSLSYTLYSIIGIIRSSLDMAWAPWCFEQLNIRNYSIIKKYSVIYADILFIVTIIIMLAVPEIVVVLAPASYFEAIYTAIPLVLASFFVLLNSLCIHILYFCKKTYIVSGGAMIAAVLNVGMNYIFIRDYGYYSAAYTTAVASLFLFYFNFFIIKYFIKFDVFSTLNFNILVLLGGLLNIICIMIHSYTVLRYLLVGILVFLIYYYIKRHIDFGKE